MGLIIDPFCIVLKGNSLTLHCLLNITYFFENPNKNTVVDLLRKKMWKKLLCKGMCEGKKCQLCNQPCLVCPPCTSSVLFPCALTDSFIFCGKHAAGLLFSKAILSAIKTWLIGVSHLLQFSRNTAPHPASHENTAP